MTNSQVSNRHVKLDTRDEYSFLTEKEIIKEEGSLGVSISAFKNLHSKF